VRPVHIHYVQCGGSDLYHLLYFTDEKHWSRSESLMRYYTGDQSCGRGLQFDYQASERWTSR
jgi:hypothetical protein